MFYYILKGRITMASVSPREVEKALKGIDYPARRQDMLKVAESNNAEEVVRRVIESLPDKTYNTPIDVTKAIGEMDRSGKGSPD
jgi:hypothetical protein